jgi:TatD DNase family protein
MQNNTIYSGLIDAHCHLYSLSDVEDAIFRARDAGVSKAIVVTEDMDSMERTLKLRDTFPDFVLPGLGIHPVNVLTMNDSQWKDSFGFLKDHSSEILCVGEIGLDYKYAKTAEEQERQLYALREQMDLAADNNLPINLHSRRALRQTMNEAIAFHKKTNLNALLHWFAHSKKLLKTTNESGVYVSVGPSILFSGESLDLALSINPDLILVETDTPVYYNGNPSSPAWVKKVAEKLISRYPENSLSKEKITENTLKYLR